MKILLAGDGREDNRCMLSCLGRGFVVAVLGAIACAGAGSSWSADRNCLGQSAASKQGIDPVFAVARQMPAIVSVLTVGQDSQEALLDDEVQMPARAPLGWTRASASGFVMSADGYVLTSAHVVTGASDTSVLDAEQRRHHAEIVGIDRRTDVAVLKISATQLPVAPVGSSARLCPGEWVGALGAPYGFERSVSAGVVSAYARFLPGGHGVPLIQTDVPLNPGNSGGPLFNAHGEVVGMNSMIYSPKGAFVGVSFALPIDTVLRIAAELRSTGRVTRGQIGARTQALTSDLAPAFGLNGAQGALIVRVDSDGPAARAGLRSGDVVLGLDDNSAMSYAEIQDRVSAAHPGSALTLTVWRRKALLTVKVDVTEMPPDLPGQGLSAPVPPELRLGLGLVERPVTQGILPLDPGLYVKTVSGSSQQAGLRLGDRILAINDVRVDRITEFDEALQSVGSAGTVALLVRRGAITTFVPVSPLHAKSPSVF